MKVLITGGAGFIGATVANNLIKNDIDVVTLDIVNPKQKLGKHLIGSIMDKEDLKQAIQGCDGVVHLAAMVGVKRTDIQAKKCLDINIEGTRNVLDAAYKAGARKIVFASSSEVYGEPQRIPVKETAQVHPKSVYGVTKLAGEEYLKAYGAEFNIDYSIVRFFNVYGIGQVAEFVMPRFIQAVISNKPPIVYGDGNQIRAFCYATDAAHGIYLALTSPQANGQIINIGNDQRPITMKELAHKVIAVSGKNLSPNFVTMESSDRSHDREIINRTPDLSKAKTILGFTSQISLEEGIKKVFDKGDIQETWFEPLK